MKFIVMNGTVFLRMKRVLLQTLNDRCRGVRGGIRERGETDGHKRTHERMKTDDCRILRKREEEKNERKTRQSIQHSDLY